MKLSLLFLLLFVTGCQPIMTTESNSNSGVPLHPVINDSTKEILYFEDFNDKKSVNIYQGRFPQGAEAKIKGGYYHLTTGYNNLTLPFSLDDGAPIQPSSFNPGEIKLDQKRNFEIEVSISGTDYYHLEFGGITRSEDSFIDSPYRFMAGMFNEKPDVGVVNTNAQHLRPGFDVYKTLAEFNRLTIQKLGDRIYFLINGHLIYADQFLPFVGDSHGLYLSSGAYYRIDYFKISYLPPTSTNKEYHQWLTAKAEPFFKGLQDEPERLPVFYESFEEPSRFPQYSNGAVTATINNGLYNLKNDTNNPIYFPLMNGFAPIYTEDKIPVVNVSYSRNLEIEMAISAADFKKSFSSSVNKPAALIYGFGSPAIRFQVSDGSKKMVNISSSIAGKETIHYKSLKSEYESFVFDRLVVRKIGERIYYLLNGKLVYAEYAPLFNRLIGGVQLLPESQLHIGWFRVSYLNDNPDEFQQLFTDADRFFSGQPQPGTLAYIEAEKARIASIDWGSRCSGRIKYLPELLNNMHKKMQENLCGDDFETAMESNSRNTVDWYVERCQKKEKHWFSGAIDGARSQIDSGRHECEMAKVNASATFEDATRVVDHAEQNYKRYLRDSVAALEQRDAGFKARRRAEQESNEGYSWSDVIAGIEKSGNEIQHDLNKVQHSTNRVIQKTQEAQIQKNKPQINTSVQQSQQVNISVNVTTPSSDTSAVCYYVSSSIGYRDGGRPLEPIGSKGYNYEVVAYKPTYAYHSNMTLKDYGKRSLLKSYMAILKIPDEGKGCTRSGSFTSLDAAMASTRQQVPGMLGYESESSADAAWRASQPKPNGGAQSGAR